VCRLADLKNFFALYTLDPNLTLHPPRAERSASQHTFAASNYRTLMLALQTDDTNLSNWIVVRAVEELIKIAAPKNWAGSFVSELNQSKKHKAFAEDNVRATAQYLCKWVRRGSCRPLLIEAQRVNSGQNSDLSFPQKVYLRCV
jgi:hypothetical protein